MRLFVSGLLLLAWSINTLNAVAQDTKPDPNRVAAVRANEILDGAAWSELFNGKDLTGWIGDTAGYEVVDGILVCKKGGKELATEKEYRDFALQFEFKLEESGNNGIGIRVPKGVCPSRKSVP